MKPESNEARGKSVGKRRTNFTMKKDSHFNFEGNNYNTSLDQLDQFRNERAQSTKEQTNCLNDRMLVLNCFATATTISLSTTPKENLLSHSSTTFPIISKSSNPSLSYHRA